MSLPDDSIFASQLLQHLIVATFVLDGDGRVVIWNRACERLTGVAAADVLGTKEHWRGFYETPRPCLADLVLEGAPARTLSELYSIDRSGETAPGTLSAENWCNFPGANGRRYVAIDAGPILAGDGTIVAVVETLRDITSQKHAQTALEALVGRDGLTGIANRRSFDDRLTLDWQNAVTLRQPMSLLMIDIDHFKPYNDTLGHQRGDDCLKHIAGIIAASTRHETDLVARYGGEEFAVILPGASARSAHDVADRIMTAVRREAIAHPGLKRRGTVTLSVGIASKSRICDSPQALIAQADAALYLAKHKGRDRVASQVELKAA